MSTQEIGWHFPPNGGGSYDGFNDAGIALFAGKPLASLTREVLQNSLDAAARMGEPVHVEFELRDFPRANGDHWPQLAEAISACQQEQRADANAQLALREAAAALDGPSIRCLRIADWYTTGLRGDHFHALVKAKGLSDKERDVPGHRGGSHGQGKSAAFVWSKLRTVLYWTRFTQDDQSVELFQGKAILMSHQADGEETHGTGFLGVVKGCREVDGDCIPEPIRKVESRPSRGDGTSVWIAGFREYSGWQQDIAASVIANFFTAIRDGLLAVTIDSDDEMQAYDLIEINSDTLMHWYDYLLNHVELTDDDDGALLESFTYWQLITQGAPIEHDDSDLGSCQLWIRVADDEDLPSSVALVRGTGMLITNDQQGLKRFPGLRPFAAVCRFTSEKGNELLRRMEPPAHDQFEPRWLPEHERSLGDSVLRRITKWIRDEIKKVAAHQPTGEATPITELAELLPDIESDEPLVGRPADKKSSGKRRRIVVKRPKPTPPNPNPRPSDSIPIRDVRQLPHSDDAKKLRIGFTPQVTALVRLRLEEAGDSEAFQRSDLRLYEVDTGAAVDVDHLAVKAGERVEFDVIADTPVDHRAWRVSAVKAADS